MRGWRDSGIEWDYQLIIISVRNNMIIIMIIAVIIGLSHKIHRRIKNHFYLFASSRSSYSVVSFEGRMCVEEN